MINPYYGTDLLTFFRVLFFRVISGGIFHKPLYIDELQIIIFSGLALSGALVGTFLTLKKMTMFANAVSHTVLLGLCVAFFFVSGLDLTITSLMLTALSTAVLTGVLVRLLVDYFKIQIDTGIAFIFCFLFALGLVVLVFLTGNVHIGIDLIMGNSDVLIFEDLIHVWMAFLLNVLILATCFRGFLVISFDPSFARLSGFPLKFFEHLIMFQISLNLIVSFKATGVLMALSFLIMPQLIVKPFIKSVRQMIVASACLGLMTAFLSPAVSRYFLTWSGTGLSTAGLTVIIFFFFYVCSLLFCSFQRKKIRGIESSY
ncbi:MAG: metal ABC transporter permease [Victivallaceae bacterium]